MSAEAIARVVSDLREGRARQARAKVAEDRTVHEYALRLAGAGPVVDATALYRSLAARDEPVYLYEEHPCIAPPWSDASICYENEHGNALVMALHVEEHDSAAAPWEPGEPVEWERVRWVALAFLWLGGRGATGPFPTAGPVHLWRLAIYDDGEPADLHWDHLVPEYPRERWDMAHLVLLGALNFLNCANVDLVEPRRTRGESRRIARYGCRVHEIAVRPLGRHTRGQGNEGEAAVPLTSVRGHFRRYGPEYGRGLLFGRLSGRFWVPQFARGAEEHGLDEHDYRLEPS